MPVPSDRIEWPDGCKFAFTIVDDTDRATVANAARVYDLLHDLGLRTTKTVWPLRPNGPGRTGGQTLEDANYRRWIERLQHRGFELALHGASDGSSDRDRVIRGLDLFHEVTGSHPTIHTNHVGQRDALYWGDERFDQPVRWLYETTNRLRGRSTLSQGHDPRSAYFWGDVCTERVLFVRSMVFPHVNTLKCDPLMPYHDPLRPHVRYWFSASYGSGLENFCALISEENQDRLLAEGGACVVHTHLGSTFGGLDDRFVRLLRRLASLPGWFAPASMVLDHIGDQRGWLSLEGRRNSLRRLQMRWAMTNAWQARRQLSSKPRRAGKSLR